MVGWQVDTQPPITLEWDDYNGRLRQSETSQLDYNLDGRLVSATSSAGTMTLAYDPLGNRIYRAFDNGVTTTERKYIVDTVGDLPVILMELDAASGSFGSLKKSYYYAQSQVLAQLDHTDPDGDLVYDDLYFYMHDRLGSVRQIIDESAQVMHYYTYDPFGQILETASVPDIAPTNAFLFTGQWYDEEIGQYYLRARMYDPALMRFTTRDPVKGEYTEPMTLHAYLYCLNDPINHTDPTGELLYLDLLWTSKLVTEMRAKTVAMGASAMTLAQRLWTAIGYRATAISNWMDRTFSNGMNQIAQIGNKLNYMFGQARGALHNIERSQEMLRQLNRIGIQDSPAARGYVNELLNKALNDPSCISKIQKNGLIVRETLIQGPDGMIKMQSFWEGTKLITFELFGKGDNGFKTIIGQ